MKADGGGPAFPVAEEKVNGITYQEPSVGMSLRDYFAARAMSMRNIVQAGEILSTEIVAKRCYEIADAMLAERDK